MEEGVFALALDEFVNSRTKQKWKKNTKIVGKVKLGPGSALFSSTDILSSAVPLERGVSPFVFTTRRKLSKDDASVMNRRHEGGSASPLIIVESAVLGPSFFAPFHGSLVQFEKKPGDSFSMQMRVPGVATWPLFPAQPKSCDFLLVVRHGENTKTLMLAPLPERVYVMGTQLLQQATSASRRAVYGDAEHAAAMERVMPWVRWKNKALGNDRSFISQHFLLKSSSEKEKKDARLSDTSSNVATTTCPHPILDLQTVLWSKASVEFAASCGIDGTMLHPFNQVLREFSRLRCTPPLLSAIQKVLRVMRLVLQPNDFLSKADAAVLQHFPDGSEERQWMLSMLARQDDDSHSKPVISKNEIEERIFEQEALEFGNCPQRSTGDRPSAHHEGHRNLDLQPRAVKITNKQTGQTQLLRVSNRVNELWCRYRTSAKVRVVCRACKGSHQPTDPHCPLFYLPQRSATLHLPPQWSKENTPVNSKSPSHVVHRQGTKCAPPYSRAQARKGAV